MNRTKISPKLYLYPEELRSFISDADIYDSSSSPEAQVIFIDRDSGYFLKRGTVGSLKTEKLMAEYFSSLSLTEKPILYLSDEYDWLLTRRVPGEDATHSDYISDGKRLASTLGELLRALHEIPHEECPVKDRLKSYAKLAEKNYINDFFDTGFCLSQKLKTKDEIYKRAMDGLPELKNDCLIHGDFCLPNVIFDNWRLSGYIDLGNAGVADRHIDLYWGAWTLNFNLKTNKYRERFFDAYGRDKIDPEKLVTVSAFEVFG